MIPCKVNTKIAMTIKSRIDTEITMITTTFYQKSEEARNLKTVMTNNPAQLTMKPYKIPKKAYTDLKDN